MKMFSHFHQWQNYELVKLIVAVKWMFDPDSLQATHSLWIPSGQNISHDLYLYYELWLFQEDRWECI